MEPIAISTKVGSNSPSGLGISSVTGVRQGYNLAMTRMRVPSRKFLANLANRRYFPGLLKGHLPIEVLQDAQQKWLRTANGLELRGPSTNSEQKIVHRLLGLRRHFPEELFGIVDELVDRYDVPRSFGGESMVPLAHPNQSKYRPYRDPFNDFDSATAAYLMANARPLQGDVAVDVGAYHGIGTLRLLQQVGPEGFVIAVEGDPDYFATLIWNLEKNWSTNNYSCVQAYASDSPSHDATVLSNDDAMVRTLEASTFEALQLSDLITTRIEAVTVDQVLAKENPDKSDLNYVTITVNGHELAVLRGMQDSIEQSSRLTISLAGWYEANGKRVADTASPWLKDRGFEVFVGERGRVLALKK